METKHTVRVIQERLEAITRALQPLDLKEPTRREIAFSIAEISPEVEELLDLIKRAGDGNAMTRADLVALQRMSYHWSQHLCELNRTLLGAFEELEELDTRRPEK